MSDFKLTFTLKQHTPIIHFQHKQAGATLRATEVKPKLDRFLIEHAFGGILNFDAYKDFLIGDINVIEKKLKEINNDQDKEQFLKKQKLAFDYKIRINDINKSEKWNITPKIRKFSRSRGNYIANDSFPPFFATIGEEWQKKPKYFIFNDSTILLEIVCFTQLVDKINNIIPLFFLMHNFGTRQSKGFGSFYLDESDDNYIKPHQCLSKENNKIYYSFRTTFSEWKDNRGRVFKYLKESNYVNGNISTEYRKQKKLFAIIDLFYKTFRSGINQQGFYLKSLMFSYAKEKLNLSWDKKMIKSKFIRKNEINNQINIYQNSDCGNDVLTFNRNSKLIRDVLGLATDQKYGSYGFTVRHPKKKDNNYELNSIERLASPIIFKPITVGDEFEVFIFYHDIDPNFFDKNITLLKTIGRGNNERIQDDLVGKTINEFSIEKYLNYIFKEIDFEKYALNCNNNKSHDFYKILSSIFQQLK